MTTPETLPQLIDHLNDQTTPPTPFYWSHTGGGCYAIQSDFPDGSLLMITAAEGPLEPSHTPQSVQTRNGGNGWTLSVYPSDGEPPDTRYAETVPDLVRAVRAELAYLAIPHTSRFLYPDPADAVPYPGQFTSVLSTGPGYTQVSSGHYDGIRPDPETGEPYHYFRDGMIGETRQPMFGIPVSHFPPTPDGTTQPDPDPDPAIPLSTRERFLIAEALERLDADTLNDDIPDTQDHVSNHALDVLAQRIRNGV